MSIAAGDVNGDGLPDIVYTANDSLTVKYASNTGKIPTYQRAYNSGKFQL